MNKGYEGIITYPNINELNDIAIENFNANDWEEVYKLTGARLIDDPRGSFKRLIFDFDGGDDYWGGYVRGFAYNDGAFNAKAHFVPESNWLPESLTGHYRETNNGIEIKGKWYATEGVFGFFIFIRAVEPKEKKIEVENVKNKNKIIPQVSKRARRKEKMMTEETYKGILNQELLDKVQKLASKQKNKKNTNIYDHYNHIIRLKPEPNDWDNIVMGMSIAYSWMPTMLDIYLPYQSLKKKAVTAVQQLGKINSLKAFIDNEAIIFKALMLLTEIVNNSIVGASKTVHIFYPKNVPILDRRVLEGWNKTFKKLYKRNPELILPATIPGNRERMVRTYMKYWKILLCWSINTGKKNLRELEELFYWVGKS